MSAPRKTTEHQKGDHRGNRTILWRTIALMIIFGVLAFIPLLITLFNIQIRDHDYYEQLAISQQTRDVAVEANRGTIFDRNGNTLAMSATVYRIIVSPRDLIQVQENYAQKVDKAKAGTGKMPTTPEPTNELVAQGLSFLTFQQLFWLRDCYFGEAGRESALDFACCLTFFATATCGPITRVGELAPQLRRPRALDWGDLAAGLYCFALGLAKKVLVASVFAQRADFGYANAGALSGVDSALTILCYTLQIYFDFSGYCDMAAGMARMMGIDLPVNFNSPYRSLSVQEFWGRWHITLSRFFRSCLYIPLGGSCRGMAVTCRNIMIVFLLSGLWHGAGWGFVLWGGLHGAAMVAQRLWGRRKFLPKPLCWLLTFAFVNVAWVFFRAESLGQAGALLGDLFTGGVALPSAEFAAALSQQQLAQLLPALEGMLGPAGELLLYWLPLLAIPAGLALLACPNPLAQAERMRPTAARAVLTVACLVVSLVFFSGVDTFIYANF